MKPIKTLNKQIDQLVSGTGEFYYYALRYLNEKYRECFIRSYVIVEPKLDPKTGLYVTVDSEYELIWEDKTPKEIVISDAKNKNYKLYGNRYAHFVNKNHRKNLKNVEGLLYAKRIVTDSIIDCIKGESRFIIIPLTVTKISVRGDQVAGSPHANMLIYDKRKRTLERYEPHGPGYRRISRRMSDIMDVDIVDYFKDIDLIKGEDDYYPPIRFCPKWEPWQKGLVGHQMLQNLESKEFSGSCATWSMWYIDQRLQNPDTDPSIILRSSIEEMQKSTKGFTKFIKKYFKIIEEYRNRKKYE